MNCPNCGTSNLDTASICANCGKALASAPAHSYSPPPPAPGSYGASPAAEAIPNYLWQSILVTLCCCLPLGVVAIVFAAQVNSKLATGDVAGARDASAKAKMFCWIAFGIGIVAYVIWIATGGLAAIQAYRDAMAAAG
ncbi:MAG: CD225/dispanin family protein [Acidobacteriota bacterium]|nr:CD225/dispanin family protein [Acidobacteriota bacterium]